MKFPRRVWLPVAGVLLLGLLLTLPKLGASGLWDPWEPKYAQAPREMAEHGTWLIPYFDNDPRLNKPPVTYWLIGISQSVFGMTETAARLPSALLSVLCATALAMAFALRGRELEGFLAGAALMTSPQWLLLGRFATPDIPLGAFLGIALAALIALPAIDDRWGRRALIAVAVAGVVLAGLTDWPRGLLIPLWGGLAWGAMRLRWPWIVGLIAACGIYFVGQHRYSLALNLLAVAVVSVGAVTAGRYEGGIRWRTWAIVLASVVLLVTPWFLVAYHLEPDELSVYRYKHAFNLGESLRMHRGPLDYPLRVVALGALPWSAAALLGFLQLFRREKRDEIACLLAGFGLGGLLFFTLAEPRMGHLYGVLQPAVAGLAGIGVVAFLRRLDWRAIPAAVALGLIAYTAWDHPSRILDTATVKSSLYGYDLALPALIAIAVWFAALLVARIAGRESWSIAAVVPAALFVGLLGMGLVPELEAKKSMKPMWGRYVALRNAGEPIGSLGMTKYGTIYYSNNSFADLDSMRDVELFVSGAQGDLYVIAAKKTYRAMLEEGAPGAGRWEILENEHPSHQLARYRP